MKRNLMLLLVSALLVYSLTACGCASKDAGTVQNGNATTENTQPGTNNNDANGNGGILDNGPADNGVGNGTNGANTGDGNTIGAGEAMIEDAGDAIKDGVNGVTDAITGTDTTNNNNGVAIDDMLRNGNARTNNVR